jgi:UDPglucose 6-dehydrogenase
MNIGIIGTGYVGLVSGTCFAESGNEVICVDIDTQKIAGLQRGSVPFYEPGLEELVRRNMEEQRLYFTTDLAAAVQASSVLFIAVGTPQRPDGSADLQYVMDTAKSIARHMNEYKIIVNKSTVPPGTAEEIRKVIGSLTSHPFAVASNPEFLKEGAAVEDFMKPDRVIIGGDDKQAIEVLREIHDPFVRTGNPILVMDTISAEMSKYASNAMLATKISFINEMAALCEKTGADIEHVRRAIGLDRRIGPYFIFPGAGYGGSCFPKDVRAMIAMESDVPLLRAVEQVNESQKRVLTEKVKSHFGRDLKDKVFAVWGLSFKPRTDDMREAPAVTVIESLLQAGARVQAFDPKAMGEAEKIFGNHIAYARSNYEAARGADALLIITEWNEFRRPNFIRLKDLLKRPVIFDGRNLYDPRELKRLGITYYAIGRGYV